MKQYLELCQRIVDQGEWVENKRTGTRCLTVINADLEYDVANNQFPRRAAVRFSLHHRCKQPLRQYHPARQCFAAL